MTRKDRGKKDKSSRRDDRERDDHDARDEDEDEEDEDEGEDEFDLSRIDRSDPALRDLIDEYEVLRVFVPQLRERLKQERAAGPPSVDTLNRSLDQARSQLARMDRDIEQSKEKARTSRSGGDDWRQWYDRLPDAEKEREWPKVQAELSRRNTELQAAQEQLAQRVQDQLKLSTEVSLANERLMAAQAGVHDQPLRKDPRLRSARKALRDARKRLRAALKQHKKKGERT